MQVARASSLIRSGMRLRRYRWSRRCAVPPEVVWERFVERCWIAGAGVGPTPSIDERGAPDGLGCTRSIATLPGRRLRERITATDHPRRLEYRVLDPSWATYPVEQHQGVVLFEPLPDGATEVTWTVAVIPRRGAGLLVGLLTRWVVTRYLAALTARD